MNACTGCTTGVTVGQEKHVAFGCQPPGFGDGDPRSKEPGWSPDPVLPFCSLTCAVSYVESRCPCGGECWRKHNVEPMRADLAAAEARVGVTT